MERRSDLERVVEQLSRDHDLDPARLEAALRAAIEAHDDEAGFLPGQKRRIDNRTRVEQLHRAMQRVRELWQSMPQDVREDVYWFSATPEGPDHIATKIDYLDGLFEEYGDHYSRPRGNPGRSRDAAAKDLDLGPLTQFVDVLIPFWMSETGRPFGHRLESTDDLEETVREEKSPSMRFLAEAVALVGLPYSAANMETVVRAYKSGR